MLAEKNPDGPKPSVSAEKSKKNAPKDSLSTIPLQIIQTAKALDVDLKKTAAASKTATATSDNDSNGFDDDLPEDFDPEDMDEDEIAKMMEEEEFAQQQLKLAGEAIRNKRLKDTNDESPKKDVSPMKIETTSPSVIMPHLAALVSPTNFTGSLTIPDIPPSMYTVAATATTSNTKITTTPKKRGRKFKDDNPLLPPTDMIPKSVKSLDLSKEPMIPVSAIQHTASLANQKPPSMQMHLGPSTMHSPPIQQHTPSVISHSSSVIQHQRSLPPSTSSLLGIARNQEPIIPSTVLEVQNTRLLDPSELGRPPQLPPSSSAMHNPAASLLDSPVKKRGRRKKITPMRDQLTSPTSAGIDLRHPNMPPSQSPLSGPPNHPTPTMPDTPKTSILSERLAGNPGKKVIIETFEFIFILFFRIISSRYQKRSADWSPTATPTFVCSFGRITNISHSIKSTAAQCTTVQQRYVSQKNRVFVTKFLISFAFYRQRTPTAAILSTQSCTTSESYITITRAFSVPRTEFRRHHIGTSSATIGECTA